MSLTPQQTCAALRTSVMSVQLATLGSDGKPHCGYTPFVFDENDIIIFVSQLSLHTRDLLQCAEVSAMLIEDEQSARQIYARTRLTLQCQAKPVAHDDARFDQLLDKLEARHGATVSLIRGLPDFILFRLVPKSGMFVMGFGKAFHLSGHNLDQFEHATSA